MKITFWSILTAAIVLVGLSLTAKAQTTANPQSETLRWNAAGFTDQVSNSTMVVSCQFITYGQSKIDWIQKNGKIVSSLNVTGVSGTWVDTNIDGSITYSVTLNDLTGTVTIQKSDTLTLELKLTGQLDKIDLLYTISNFDKL